MRQIKATVREYGNFLRENKVLIGFILGCLGIGDFVYLKYSVKEILPDILLSYADRYILSAAKYYFILIVVPVGLFLLIKLSESRFYVTYIIRNKSFRNYWIKLSLYSVFHSLFLSASYLVIIFCVSVKKGTAWINFNEKRSLFYYFSKGKIEENVPFVFFLLIWFCFIFCMILLSSMAYLLCNWVSANRIFSFLLIIGLEYMDFFSDIPISAFSRTSIFYDHWYPNIQFHFLDTLLIILLLFIIGMGYSKHKEIKG